jgi:hypothetical protein
MTFSSFNGGFSCWASRVSPRRATYFLLLRQEKVSKEKATRVFASPSLRYGATCAAREARAGRKLALRAQTCVPLDPRFAALLGATTREGREQGTRAGGGEGRSSVSLKTGGASGSSGCLSPYAIAAVPSSGSDAGSPFFWVLFFGEAKKSTSAAGPRPG